MADTISPTQLAKRGYAIQLPTSIWYPDCTRMWFLEVGKMANNATDPVCGMSVNKDDSTSSNYRGETYYFCSDDCKTKFDRSPERFAKESAAR